MLFNIFRIVLTWRFVGENTNKGKMMPKPPQYQHCQYSITIFFIPPFYLCIKHHPPGFLNPANLVRLFASILPLKQTDKTTNIACISSHCKEEYNLIPGASLRPWQVRKCDS
jgi:hypothetical protein